MGTAWPGHSEWVQLRPDFNLAANDNNGDAHLQLQMCVYLEGAT